MPALRIFLLGALGASILLLVGFTAEQRRKPDISWQMHKLEVQVQQGTQISEDIGFITNRNLHSVRVWVSREIEQYVFARPLYFEEIKGGSVVRLQIIFIVPENLSPHTYDGTVHIRVDNRTIAQPLPILLKVIPKPEPTPSPSPSPIQSPVPSPTSQPIELFYDDGTAEGFDFDPVLGRVVFFTKFVTADQSVKILGAKIFVKTFTLPASPMDVYVWNFDRQQMIAPVRVTPSDDGWMFVDLSQHNLVVSNEFYIGIAWPSAEAPPLLGVDFNFPQGKSFVVILSSNTFIPVVNSNFMIRALVEKI